MYVHTIPQLSNDLQDQLYEYTGYAQPGSPKPFDIDDRSEVTKGQIIKAYTWNERRVSELKRLARELAGTSNKINFSYKAPFDSLFLAGVEGGHFTGANETSPYRSGWSPERRVRNGLTGIFCAFASEQKHRLTPYTIYKPFFDAVKANETWLDDSLKRGMYGRDWKSVLQSEIDFSKSIICETIPWDEYHAK